MHRTIAKRWIFFVFFLLTKFQFLRVKMTVEDVVIDLLDDKTPTKARDLMLSWAERRNAS
jgi:hypothetical protein